MIVINDYGKFRIDVEGRHTDGLWNAEVRIRRVLSDEKPHVQTITCRKATASAAEQAGEIWARRWVDRHGNESAPL